MTEVTQELRPWTPAGLKPREVRGLSYVVVDEIEGGAVGLAVSEWPRIDGEGRLRFGAPPVLLGADRASLEAFLDRHRQTSRPLRSGDVFGLRARRERLREAAEAEARLEPMLEPETWIEPPVYDVTADARDAAKASFYAAVTTPLIGPEIDLIEELIERPSPPPPPPAPPRPPRPWWRSPFFQVAAAAIVFGGGLGAGFAAGAAPSNTVATVRTTIPTTIRTTIPSIVDHTTKITVRETVTGTTPGTTTEATTAQTVTVPNVVGSSEADAVATLGDAKLDSTATTAASGTDAGIVIAQDPTAGTEVAEGSTVTIVVSSGPAKVTVPDVVGLDEKTAIARLTEARFSPSVATKQTSTGVGTVLSQDPAGGTQADPGTSVTIVVGIPVVVD